jgi:hypothetical protein
LKEVTDQFTKDTGNEVKLAFGSSGNFTTQNPPLTFGVPPLVAPRNRLEPGEPATVSLLADAIHLMRAGEPD